MSPEAALVRARGIYGRTAFTMAHKAKAGAPARFIVGDQRHGMRLVLGQGATWEEALDEAERDAFGAPLRLLPEECAALLGAAATDPSRQVSRALIERLSDAQWIAQAKVDAANARRRGRK